MKLDQINSLIQYLDQFQQCSIAVSGGVDSMLLAYLAHQFSVAKVKVLHASSPAVPESALARVQEYALKYNWDLQVIDAGEFSDENYLNNPVNRCYFCKSNLYSRIAEYTDSVIFSGANLDDLGDYRPGLDAARELDVKHPYLEVGITKTNIYAIAEHYQLTQLHSLPAQPCLASRVETGIKIKTEDMHFIDDVEHKVRQVMPKLKNIRCRISHVGISVELDRLPEGQSFTRLHNTLSQHCSEQGRVFSGMKVYQKGSAFLNGISHG